MNHALTKTLANAERPQKSGFFMPYVWLSLVWFGTVSLSITVVNDQATAGRFKLSQQQLHAIQLIFALPGLLILLAILFACLTMWRYARAIGNSDEGRGFRFIGYGMFALLVGLVLGDYISNLQQILAQHAADPQKVKDTFVILNNYVSAIVAFITYGSLLRGSHLLLRSIGKRLDVAKRLVPLAVAFVVLTAAYLWLIHSNPASRAATSPDVNPAFGLPYWLIVLTVALPFVVSWFIGVLALMGMYQYRAQTTGIVYKLLFKRLIVGLTLFIGLTILLQLLTQLSSFYTTRSVSLILGLIVVVYGVLAYAFIIIAQGAKKLHTIEKLLIE